MVGGFHSHLPNAAVQLMLRQLIEENRAGCSQCVQEYELEQKTKGWMLKYIF